MYLREDIYRLSTAKIFIWRTSTFVSWYGDTLIYLENEYIRIMVWGSTYLFGERVHSHHGMGIHLFPEYYSSFGYSRHSPNKVSNSKN